MIRLWMDAVEPYYTVAALDRAEAVVPGHPRVLSTRRALEQMRAESAGSNGGIRATE